MEKLERASSPRPPVVGAGLTFFKVGFLNLAVRAYGQCAEKQNQQLGTTHGGGLLSLSTLDLVSVPFTESPSRPTNKKYLEYTST